jgi:RNA-directed DNA polymerase
MNIGAPWPDLVEAESRVRGMQSKLHQWAVADPDRRFDDLYNLVYDPAFLAVAWGRVRSNKGARTAGVDGIAPCSIGAGVGEFLGGLQEALKSRRYAPTRVREKIIPKTAGKVRRLGIPTAADRVVQASLKLVMEPIFEADFKACFDEIKHSALMDRVRRRIKDKRVLRLVRAFLRAGILSEDGVHRQTITGTPQGGTLSPLLANIALSVLDEHFTEKWEALGPAWTRVKRRRSGVPVMRLSRYADDFVVLVGGTRADSETLWDEVATVLATIGLRLSAEKTRVCHIDDGFDFLGWRIQRQSWHGRPGKRVLYTYPSKKALRAVMAKVRSLTQRNQHRNLADLLRAVNRTLQGWCAYFRYGVSARTFSYLDHFTWWRIFGWLRKRHAGLNLGTLVKRFLPRWEILDGQVELFRPARMPIARYRFRGARIPTPWTSEAA